MQRGWAIECRIYAEDPENNFLPSPGRIEVLQAPTGLGVRDDSGVYEGFEVSTFYDPILVQAGRVGCHARGSDAAHAARAA